VCCSARLHELNTTCISECCRLVALCCSIQMFLDTMKNSPPVDRKQGHKQPLFEARGLLWERVGKIILLDSKIDNKALANAIRGASISKCVPYTKSKTTQIIRRQFDRHLNSSVCSKSAKEQISRGILSFKSPTSCSFPRCNTLHHAATYCNKHLPRHNLLHISHEIFHFKSNTLLVR